MNKRKSSGEKLTPNDNYNYYSDTINTLNLKKEKHIFWTYFIKFLSNSSISFSASFILLSNVSFAASILSNKIFSFNSSDMFSFNSSKCNLAASISLEMRFMTCGGLFKVFFLR